MKSSRGDTSSSPKKISALCSSGRVTSVSPGRPETLASKGCWLRYLGPQHEQLHLQGLVGLRRQRKGVVEAAAAGFEKLHILEFDAAAALGRKGKDAEAELVRRHLLDQGRVDAAAHDGVVNPARRLLFHDDPLHHPRRRGW